MANWSRVVAWRLLDGTGWEHAAAQANGLPHSGVRYEGTVIAVEGHQPVKATYSILIDQASGRCQVSVSSTVGANEVYSAHLERDRFGVWQRAISADSEQSLETDPALSGATEPDIEFSPITNTLAINRLNLAVGESAELVTAWIRFPKLTVEPYPQRYSRLAERIYRFESEGFEAELEVDDLNLVVRYGDLWERVAVSDGE